MDYEAVKLIEGELLRVGEIFSTCVETESQWTISRIWYDREASLLVVVELAAREGGIMSMHYPLSSIKYLCGHLMTKNYP